MLCQHFVSCRLMKVVGTRSYCDSLPTAVTTWLEEMCDMLHPKTMHICKGTLEERESIIQELIDSKTLIKCQQQENCFVARSAPEDTGRDPSRVFVAAYNRDDFLTTTAMSDCDGYPPRGGSLLGNYISMTVVDHEINSRFYKSMKGRKMYVVPFMLGPPDSDAKLLGFQVTDSGLAALLTSIQVRSGAEAIRMLQKKQNEGACSRSFLKLIHATGCDPDSPLHWRHDRSKYIVINFPEKREIWSYGSSYWENSMLVKKGGALQLAAHIGRKENFLPLNMSVLSVENQCGTKFIGVVGPEGSGKSVMASMTGQSGAFPIQAKLLSDDITWVKLDLESGNLRAINPESGIFPFVRGVNICNTPVLFTGACSNSVMLNTAIAGEDSAWWEGLDAPDRDSPDITDWRLKPWLPEGPRAAHLDARFINSMVNMTKADKRWQCGEGVPLSAIIVLTRRHQGHPLVLETASWAQGILHLAANRTRYHNQALDDEELHWEPMGSRHYLGYNLGKMIDNWMSLCTLEEVKLPRVFLVNLFLMDNWLKDPLWVGYESNVSIINWIVDRLDCKATGQACPLGLMPCEKEFDMPLRQIYTFDSIINFDQDYWLCEMNNFEKLLREQLPDDTPPQLCKELADLKGRLDPVCPPVPCPCCP